MSTPTPPPDPLDPLFERWREIAPEPAENLESAVWTRLAAQENQSAAHVGWRDAVETVFSRASFKVVFVAACVLLGLFLAEARVSRTETRRAGEFVQGYLRQIDPQFTEAAVAESPAPSRS